MNYPNKPYSSTNVPNNIENFQTQENSQQIEQNNQHPVRTVSELLTHLKNTFYQCYRNFFLKAEISSLKQHNRNCYLTLKDLENNNKIRAVVWDYAKVFEESAQAYGFSADKIKEGALIILFGSLDLFQTSGEIQINIKSLKVFDLIGEQKAEIERNRQEIYHFNLNINKKPIPKFPNTVGLITSCQASGLQDMLSVFRKSAPDISLIIYDCQVQGENSARSIVQAIETANYEKRADLLIVGRGGGAFEHLLSFSDREVIYAIYNSEIPIISAVGHQTDNPLSDLVADEFCVTPTAAANFVVNPRLELRRVLMNHFATLTHIKKIRFNRWESELRELEQTHALFDPMRRIENFSQQLTNLHRDLIFFFQKKFDSKVQELQNLRQSLFLYNPYNKLNAYQNICIQEFNKIKYLADNRFKKEINDFTHLKNHLIFLKQQKLDSLKQSFFYLEQNFDYIASQNLRKYQHELQNHQELIVFFKNQLNYLLANKLKALTTESLSLAKSLIANDPELPLQRGYAMLFDNQGAIIDNIADLKQQKEFTIKINQQTAHLEAKFLSEQEKTKLSKNQKNSQLAKSQIESSSKLEELKLACKQLIDLVENLK